MPDDGVWFIAYKGDVPAAYAGITEFGIYNKKTKQFSENSGVGLLVRCGVSKDHRGYGLQRRLIEARMVAAKEMNFNFVYSTTFDNPESSNNLIACGFRLYSPKKPWGAYGTNYWQKEVEK